MCSGLERDLRGLTRLRPGREAREIESPDRLARLRVEPDVEGERDQLGLVSRLDVVGTFVTCELPPDDVSDQAAVGLRRPELVGVVERRADRVVDVHALGHPNGIVHDAQAPQEECFAFEVILDLSRGVVVRDVGARLAPLHGKEGLGPQRRPAPLAKGPGRLDPIGDPVTLSRDCYFVPTTGLVDGLR